MIARGDTPTPALPRKRERERSEPWHPPATRRERSEPLFPSPACGGGWRARQRATGGGSRRTFRYRMDPRCGLVRNDNNFTEDTP